jgi:hypothetical protein
MDIQQLAMAIEELEQQSAREEMLLKEEVKKTFESLRPLNLVKKTISDLSEQPGLKNDLLDTGMSLLAGYSLKKVVTGSTHNPLKQLMGTILQIIVTKAVSNNTDKLRRSVSLLINKFKNR